MLHQHSFSWWEITNKVNRFAQLPRPRGARRYSFNMHASVLFPNVILLEANKGTYRMQVLEATLATLRKRRTVSCSMASRGSQICSSTRSGALSAMTGPWTSCARSSTARWTPIPLTLGNRCKLFKNNILIS